MARKSAIPSQQLERLKELYNQEREALLALARAQEGVSSAEEDVAAAQETLKEAQSGVDAAYHALVALVGASVAAELTGRNPGAARRTRAQHPDRSDGARAQRGAIGHDDTASPAMIGGPVG